MRDRGLGRWVRFESCFGAKFEKYPKCELFKVFGVDRKLKYRTMEGEPKDVVKFDNSGILVGETKWIKFFKNAGSAW